MTETKSTDDMDMITDPNELTPWELRNGRWYKREDYHRNAYGVNGAKYRVCRHLISKAVDDGAQHIISASSVRSPQAAIAATLAEEMGLLCTIVVGASKPETAIKHESIRIAVEAGAKLDTSRRVAYNGVIQPYAAELAEVALGGYQVPYAISPPADASQSDLQDFLDQGGWQIRDMPKSIKTLVIAFGSGNTTAGVLYGLSRYAGHVPERVVLVGVGPDRTEWLYQQLIKAGAEPSTFSFDIDHMPLHGWFAEYADLMPETVDDIVMHPTYEGKVVRFLNGSKFDWWHDRDGTTGLWIVGGPM